jgi:uncharacterized membrane protein
MLAWITNDTRNALIALVLSAVLGGVVSATITVVIRQPDDSKPPAWMQTEKSVSDTMRDRDIAAMKRMLGH